MITDLDAFYHAAAPYGPLLHGRTQANMERRDARVAALKAELKRLPDVQPSYAALDQDRVTIGKPEDLSGPQSAILLDVLRALKPWRKGPFDLFGIQIDGEWDSALKWQRLAPHLADLHGRRVLDVGSSNGYYLFRMAAARPRMILGIEPYALYYIQFLALRHLLPIPRLYSLPLKLEDMPAMRNWFDTVFCMGMLYHRRSPLDTLARINSLMARGGQLIVETLIIKGDDDLALCPGQRYARMRNVYFIPTVKSLRNWLTRRGFGNIQCVDITLTTTREQRRTEWMASDSLDSFLDPADNRRTVEGYPAPLRAMLMAEKVKD